MQSIYSKITEIESEGRKAALCIVVDTKGSTPRKSASKMLVFDDKSIYGTIGGGSIEKQVIEDAAEAISSGKTIKKNYDLYDDLGMICGGSMEVYIEPLMPRLKLYIFGAGHVGTAVAQFALSLGFDITLFDDRVEMFADKQVPGCRLILKNYFEAIKDAVFDENTYIVIVTPKHAYDEEILEALIKKQYAYIGMIGSRAKVAAVRKKFIENSIATAEELDAVDMPIGIKFAAETPQEIAISIMAKIIDVKNTVKL